MKRLTRLAVLSVLVPALALPAGAASAKDHGGGGGGGGPLCWVLGWGCDDDNGDDDDDVVVAPAPAYLIQGVAVDSSGKGLDNVAVQALDASTGQPVATALTYASARRNGPQHGYFYLYVDRGVYDVALVKRGYDASFVQDVNVNGRKDVSLGQLTLGLRDWPTSTVAEVVDPVVTPNEPVLVDVTVDSEKAKVTGGRVVVSVRPSVTAAGVEDGIDIVVRDTGIGMDAEEIEVALLPFGQVDQGLARRHEGTGLGLPLTRRMIELHQGKLLLTSARGKGTTVTLHFPKNRVIVPELAARGARRPS